MEKITILTVNFLKLFRIVPTSKMVRGGGIGGGGLGREEGGGVTLVPINTVGVIFFLIDFLVSFN